MTQRISFIGKDLDPSSITTLEKVAEKVKLEDSGAYKQLSRMLISNREFKSYLFRRRMNEVSKNPGAKRKKKNVHKKQKH